MPAYSNLQPPVPIHYHAFVDDELNPIVKVHKDGRITLFIGHHERAHAAFQYKDLHKDCARTVAFYEERYPEEIPDILAGLKMTEPGPATNPPVPPDDDYGKAPF